MAAAILILVTSIGSAAVKEPLPGTPPEKIIIDTDIGDDIDDAFAAALALRTPRVQILGFSTAYGDTYARAAILDRLLGETGNDNIPVAVGVETSVPGGAEIGTHISQRHYGEDKRFSRDTHPNSVDFILEQIRRHPGEITLVTIGPLSNVGSLIDRDIATFRKLKRVVAMGGSIEVITPDYGDGPSLKPVAEWNIKADIPAAKKLFNAGVPIYLMPLDSTLHLKFDEMDRLALFSEGTPLTDALSRLYQLWNLGLGVEARVPTLFDVMTIVFISNSQLCPVTPAHIIVDNEGFTKITDGERNAYVCLHSNAAEFVRFFMEHMIGSRH